MGYITTRHSGLLDRKYWEFFIPTILMAMTTTMSIVVDSIIVGNILGTNALAAVNLVMPVMMIYNTIAVALGLGAATVISVAKGRRQTTYSNEIFTVTLLGMLILSALFLGGQALFIDEITQILTHKPTLRPLVTSYLSVLMYGTPLVVVILGMTYCLRVDGRVKLASAVLIIANVVNIILDLVYMGPLKMGIAGSSLATVSGYLVGAILLGSYIFSQKRTLRINWKICKQPVKIIQYFWTILTTGSPAAMGSILISLKILCINNIVLAVAGKSGMVAFSVCLSCLSLVSMFISGAAQAMTPIVGVLYGEGDYSGVRFVVKRAFTTLIITSLIAVIILEVEPTVVLKLFGVTLPMDFAEGIPAIRIFAISLVGTSFSFLSMFYYMTIGHKKLSNAISVTQGFLAIIPTAFVLSHAFGVTGVWIAFSIAEAITIIMVVLCYLHMKQTHPARYHDILLLDYSHIPQGPTLEITCTNTIPDVTNAMQDITDFLTPLCPKTETVTKVTEALSEMALNITKHGYLADQKDYFDIKLQIRDEDIAATLRDSGLEFNPNAYIEKHNTAEDQNALLDTGLMRAKSATENMEYARAIGFNTNTLIFDK